jgi:hypothetical protein
MDKPTTMREMSASIQKQFALQKRHKKRLEHLREINSRTQNEQKVEDDDGANK